MLEHIAAWLFPPQCGGCDAIGSGLCERCVPAGPPLDATTATLRVRAIAPYDGAMRRAILALKAGRRDVAASIGQRMTALVNASDVLVPVPTTFTRRLSRGFDGSTLLAGHAARDAGATVLPLLRQTAGDAQRGRGRAARLQARGRFGCNAALTQEVVLLDDVMTTGSTLEDCAATLRARGAVVRRAVVAAVREHL